MRIGYRVLIASLCGLCLLSACKQGGGKARSGEDVRKFWEGKTLLEEDIQITEDQFADFAELTVSAPEDAAIAGIDKLFDRLKKEDEVAYYIYSEWMIGAFYNLLSPCRNPVLFASAINRMEKDAVLDENTLSRYRSLLDYAGYNNEGDPCTLPEGVPAPDSPALYLIVNLNCPTCTEAFQKLNELSFDGKHIALVQGGGPLATTPSIAAAEGWQFYFPVNMNKIFDPDLTPVYFTVDATGKVLETYKLVY